MDADGHERVRERAHQLWVQEDCPENRDDEHWHQAQHELTDELGTTPVAAEQIIPVEPTSISFPAARDPENHLEADPDTILAVADAATLLIAKKGTPLLKLKLRQCRYVISDTCSPAICCGAPAERGSWCEEHRARVFVRSSARAPLPERAAKPQIERARF